VTDTIKYKLAQRDNTHIAVKRFVCGNMARMQYSCLAVWQLQ
jgi:hypothetical protein